MSGETHVRWRCDGWQGAMALEPGVNPGRLVAAASGPSGRASRHAWTRALDGADGGLWLKVYPAPDGRRAWRAWRMGQALTSAGFAVPEAVLVGRRGPTGLLVTRDVGGQDLLHAVAAARGARKRDLLRRLGRAVGDLHAAGFVHGDLVPSNVHVCGETFVLLDHDRTRRGRLLVWWGARRNLVQLGRFVVAGVTATDRVRVLCAYADRRGLSRRLRHRLARWVAQKILARRIAIDHVSAEVAARAGFARVMRGEVDADQAGGEPQS